MILDPFDRSYNPSKSIRLDGLMEKKYLACFGKTLLKILDEGSLESFA